MRGWLSPCPARPCISWRSAGERCGLSQNRPQRRLAHQPGRVHRGRVKSGGGDQASAARWNPASARPSAAQAAGRAGFGTIWPSRPMGSPWAQVRAETAHNPAIPAAAPLHLPPTGPGQGGHQGKFRRKLYTAAQARAVQAQGDVPLRPGDPPDLVFAPGDQAGRGAGQAPEARAVSITGWAQVGQDRVKFGQQHVEVIRPECQGRADLQRVAIDAQPRQQDAALAKGVDDPGRMPGRGARVVGSFTNSAPKIIPVARTFPIPGWRAAIWVRPASAPRRCGRRWPAVLHHGSHPALHRLRRPRRVAAERVEIANRPPETRP